LSLLSFSKYDLTTFKENTLFTIPSDNNWMMVKRSASRRGCSHVPRDMLEDDSNSKPAVKATVMKFAPITPGKDNQA